MVNCSKCGHEFLCDREKLIPKKPFAKAKKAVSVHSPKDRREAIQSALVETGLIQLVCLCASLAVAAGCVWIFYNASSEMDGTFFLSMLQQPQQKAFALFFACLAGGLMACAGRRHKIVFILLGFLAHGILGVTGGELGLTEVSAKEVGIALFGPYVLAVELASILLLAGLVTAYHLGREDKSGEVLSVPRTTQEGGQQ